MMQGFMNKERELDVRSPRGILLRFARVARGLGSAMLHGMRWPRLGGMRLDAVQSSTSQCVPLGIGNNIKPSFY